MDRRSFLTGAACCLVASRARATNALVPWNGPAAAPPIDLLSPEGTPFALGSLRGHVVLVNFWATWCEPCVAEMPSLQRLRERWAPRLEIVGVNYMEGPARIKAFVSKAGITFPIVRDTDGAAAKEWGARVFPSTFVVDREGRIASGLVGSADWTSPALVSTIRELL